MPNRRVSHDPLRADLILADVHGPVKEVMRANSKAPAQRGWIARHTRAHGPILLPIEPPTTTWGTGPVRPKGAKPGHRLPSTCMAQKRTRTSRCDADNTPLHTSRPTRCR